MIFEDYVSYEVAKLLKEKGFDGVCFRIIREDGDEVERPSQAWNGMTKKQKAEFYLCPTHQMVMKWFREKDIRICLDYSDVDGKWFAMIGTKKKRTYSGYYDSYEQAVEVACLYVLKNLL